MAACSAAACIAATPPPPPLADGKQGSLAEGRAEAADHHEAVTVAVKQQSNPFDNDLDCNYFYFIVSV